MMNLPGEILRQNIRNDRKGLDHPARRHECDAYVHPEDEIHDDVGHNDGPEEKREFLPLRQVW